MTAANAHTLTATETPTLRLTAGSVSVGEVRLLDDVNLSLTPATVTGLIGPNGAGKSTLARALARQRPLTSGECTLEGKPYSAFTAREFSRRIAYLPQAIPPTNGLTVEELVSMGRYPWHGALGKFTDLDRAAVKEALSITNTDNLAGRLTDALSGGERQRCWIAMLLAQKADILLLDEPVSALDIRYQIETMSLIRDISRARNVSILVILHDINLAARYCDHVVAMKTGSIAWQGPAPDLIDKDVLERIYETPMAVISTNEPNQRFAFANLPGALSS